MPLDIAAATLDAAADDRLIVGLDLPSRAEAEAIVAKVGDAVSTYKIGLQLLAGEGMALAKDLKREGRKIFLDWKLHDIGDTVARAAAAIAATGTCDLLTVHAEPQVMAGAVRGRGGAKGCRILAVTVLTSLTDADLTELGYGMGVAALVERRVRQAVDAGVDGVVASPHEAALARRIGGPDFLVVTPGVRPAGADLNDQARAATPAQAVRNGASHIVVARPVVATADPRAAAQAIVDEMRAG
jgi:orotidine-5'-phosphate decarboxylase